MEIEDIKVDTTASATLPFEETLIMPLGDVHLGDQGCQAQRFKRDIQWGIDHNAYFLGMGDYFDILSPSNRARLKEARLYDSAEDVLEQITQQKIDEFLSLTTGSEGRWLGFLEGHHYYEFRDGSTTDTRLARALGSVFLGTCAFIRLRFKRGIDEKAHHAANCVIWCHHGTGSGQKTSAPLNKLENIMPYFRADIYLIGHQHKKVGAPIDQLYMTERKPYDIKYRTKLIACTGGYLQGYTKGARQGGTYPRGGYLERGMRPPVSLGCILLYIRPVYERNGYRLDINVSL